MKVQDSYFLTKSDIEKDILVIAYQKKPITMIATIIACISILLAILLPTWIHTWIKIPLIIILFLIAGIFFYSAGQLYQNTKQLEQISKNICSGNFTIIRDSVQKVFYHEEHYGIIKNKTAAISPQRHNNTYINISDRTAKHAKKEDIIYIIRDAYSGKFPIAYLAKLTMLDPDISERLINQ